MGEISEFALDDYDNAEFARKRKRRPSRRRKKSSRAKTIAKVAGAAAGVGAVSYLAGTKRGRAAVGGLKSRVADKIDSLRGKKKRRRRGKKRPNRRGRIPRSRGGSNRRY